MPNPKPEPDPFLENVGRLEPQIWSGWSGTCSAADISIAISLKRIADALNPATGPTFNDRLEEALQRGIENGANNAISMWQHRR